MLVVYLLHQIVIQVHFLQLTMVYRIYYKVIHGDMNNFELLASTRVEQSSPISPIYITLDINRKYNTTTVIFESSTTGKTNECVINDIIPTRTNTIANFFGDNNDALLGLINLR